jgi:hypothetical protein
MRDPQAASHREQLADVRPVQAKAHLAPQAAASRLREVCADTIRTVSGNARAAAIDMQIHEGHLSRSLKDGTIRIEQLEALGPAFAAKFGQELVEKFGPLADPKSEARRTIRDIEERLNTLKQFIEDVA